MLIIILTAPKSKFSLLPKTSSLFSLVKFLCVFIELAMHVCEAKLSLSVSHCLLLPLFPALSSASPPHCLLSTLFPSSLHLFLPPSKRSTLYELFFACLFQPSSFWRSLYISIYRYVNIPFNGCVIFQHIVYRCRLNYLTSAIINIKFFYNNSLGVKFLKVELFGQRVYEF